MVDFEPRDARDFHGRDGRDGRERRPADHYVGISHPHFDRRMGHYGLYDYHDAHAAFGGLDRRPHRQQTDVYSGVGALHLRIVALRPRRERYVPDFGPCPARLRQRHHPIARPGDRYPGVSSATAGAGPGVVVGGGRRFDLVRSSDRRLSGGRLQLAPDLRCQCSCGTGGHSVCNFYPEGVARCPCGQFRLAGFSVRGLFHAPFYLRTGPMQFAFESRGVEFSGGDRMFCGCGCGTHCLYRPGAAVRKSAVESETARRT